MTYTNQQWAFPQYALPFTQITEECSLDTSGFTSQWNRIQRGIFLAVQVQSQLELSIRGPVIFYNSQPWVLVSPFIATEPEQYYIIPALKIIPKSKKPPRHTSLSPLQLSVIDPSLPSPSDSAVDIKPPTLVPQKSFKRGKNKPVKLFSNSSQLRNFSSTRR
ncbi:hypothetical protein BCR33DRAFT_711950 [Rhizoclosmatium globosum]|uniref:Uncharacterized protein n=1 Tax=Rhizoclosmatium globosum TaxID=329046 RepID=A0A1Y2D085_9FUNG|nr:hypothetical protein BCR33DRAFT_711950 [Rhizoclosmatium globosum]|eukprot:ORY52688.1 hypothetical protein BCR33DRAFT_711950 [Rhizoclosmatium globosum]